MSKENKQYEALYRLEDVRKLIDCICPPFASPHEAFAIMNEEYEEFQEKSDELNSSLGTLWRAIKNNRNIDELLLNVIDLSRECILELIQVSVIAQKARDHTSEQGG